MNTVCNASTAKGTTEQLLIAAMSQENRPHHTMLRIRPDLSMGWIFVLCITISSVLQSQDDSISVRELKSKSLEDLMQIEITTASKRAAPLFNVPSAVHVITQEEIRRSGVTTLPEALRLAPNLSVTQVDSRQWAISARGFSGTTSNKLLVLIDGRVVYTPLFSGVFWDVQNVFLEDVDRIEIISGPGGALWGANAVNGIINVISRKSSDAPSQNVHIYGGIGAEKRGFAGARYGGTLGEKGSFRIYGMWFDQNETKLPDGGGASDHFDMAQGGFRSDWDFSSSGLTLQGDLYAGAVNQAVADDILLKGGNVLTRFEKHFSERSILEIQAYIDITHRRIPGTFGEDLGTFDIDVQHLLTLEGHDVVWGGGFRHFNDRVVNSASLAFLPARLKLNTVSAFIQDEISVIPQILRLTLGSKLESNHYAGFEFQPSARISFLFSPNHFFWGSVSRAVRTPSRIDRDFFVPGIPPHTFLAGGPNFTSENVIAYELGYRYSSAAVTMDVATFYNSYDDLRSFEPGSPPVLDNGLEATSYGAEIAATVQLANWWRLQTGYALFNKDVRPKPGSTDLNNGQGEGNDPRHRVKIHSFMDLPWNLSADAWLRFVDELRNSNARVPGFVTLDARVGIVVSNKISISVVGQHLLQKSHSEFGAPATRKALQRHIFIETSVKL